MTSVKIVPVTMKFETSCGPACVETITATVGVTSQHDVDSQRALMRIVSEIDLALSPVDQDDWYTSPLAMEVLLRDLGFQSLSLNSASTATEAICAALASPGTPAAPVIALVWKGGHYVVVHGCDLPGAAGAMIEIVDPNGAQSRRINLSEWERDYCTPVRTRSPHDGTWEGRFVILARPSAGPAAVSGAAPAIVAARVSRRGWTRLSPDEARLRLTEAIKQRQPGNEKSVTLVREPVFVDRLDRPHGRGDYVLALARTKGGLAAVRADALAPQNQPGPVMLEWMFLGQEFAVPPLQMVDPTELTALLLDGGKPLVTDFPNEWRTNLASGAAVLRPNRVWAPCRQSPSPFRPFWMLTSARRRLFIDSAGICFPRLDVFTTARKPGRNG